MEPDPYIGAIPTSQEAALADFQAIKERVSIEQAAQSLGLEMRPTGAQSRGACPACGTGGPRALVITPSKQLFYCFSAGIGGDLISLWGHVQRCSLADAGRQIEATFRLGNVTSEPSAPVHRSTTSQPPSPPAPQSGFQALDYLEAEHPAVSAAGFNSDEAAKLGIGYAPKGIMRGTVAVPIRDEEGTLLGYIGVTEAKCPPKGFLLTNVVPLPKRA
jgi:DNA primase